MGQAAVDLPDTPSTPAVSAASTDDLLAQMAGEEIDRLLAEADGPRPASAAPAQAAAPVSPLPFLSPSAQVAANEAPPAPEPATSQLTGFLGGLAADSGPDPVTELAASSRAPTTGNTAGENRPDPLDDGEDSSAERAALTSSSMPRSTTEVAGVSMVLRVLAWMNSPLESCPDSVRDAIGKIAILTAVNAASVFAYVLFFRHH